MREHRRLGILDFALGDEEPAAIATLDRGLRTGPHPGTLN